MAVTADQIDAGFAPRLRTGVAATDVDGETLVLDQESGATMLLEGTAVVVWKCLDGTSTIGEISADLAEAYSAPPEQVLEDVLRLVRQLGAMRWFDNAGPPPPPPPPISHVVGTLLDQAPRPDLGGVEHSLAELAGRRAVLVNWSAGCGWCQKIAPDLVEAQPLLAAQGVALVLLVNGDPQTNADYLAEQGLAPDLALRGTSGDNIFDRHGTPAGVPGRRDRADHRLRSLTVPARYPSSSRP